MNGRRSDFHIIVEILNLAENGAGQTRIMYGCNLNYARLKEYLASLEARGLIESERGPQRISYTTTTRGKMVRAQVEKAVSALNHEPLAN